MQASSSELRAKTLPASKQHRSENTTPHSFINLTICHARNVVSAPPSISILFSSPPPRRVHTVYTLFAFPTEEGKSASGSEKSLQNGMPSYSSSSTRTFSHTILLCCTRQCPLRPSSPITLACVPPAPNNLRGTKETQVHIHTRNLTQSTRQGRCGTHSSNTSTASVASDVLYLLGNISFYTVLPILISFDIYRSDQHRYILYPVDICYFLSVHLDPKKQKLSQSSYLSKTVTYVRI